jgi:hypothetical protein
MYEFELTLLQGVDRFTNDLAVYTVLMDRQQLNEIAQHSAGLYESTRKECEFLAIANRKEIDELRGACREKLDETLFKIGEKLVINNDKAVAHLQKTLLEEHVAMKEKSTKQQGVMEYHLRELSKVRFLSARCYLILKRNGIVEDDKEWTANEEKRKTTEMIEDSQKKIATYDRNIRDMRVKSTQLEESFELKALKDPSIMLALKSLNSNILERDLDDDGPVSVIRAGEASIHMPTFLNTIRRILDKTPLLLKQFETETNPASRSRARGKQQRLSSGRTSSRSPSRVGRNRTPRMQDSLRSSMGSTDPFPAGSLNNSGNHSRGNNRSTLASPVTSSPILNFQRQKSSVSLKPLGMNSTDSVLVEECAKHVAFSGEQLFSPEFTMDNDEKTAYFPPIRGPPAVRRKSAMMIPGFSIIDENHSEHTGNQIPAMKSQMGCSSGNTSGSTRENTTSTERYQSTRAPSRDYYEIPVQLSGRRMSSVTGGQLIQSVRNTMDIERNNNDVEIIVQKHGLIDDYQAQITKVHESSKQELSRLEEERKTVKALWKMKTQSYKKMMRSERSIKTVMKTQENMVRIAVNLTSRKTKDQGIQCEVSGKSFADFKKKSSTESTAKVTEYNLELKLGKTNRKLSVATPTYKT